MRNLMQYQAPRLFNWLRKMGKYFPFVWRYLSGVCESCGVHCGFQSTISKYGFQCELCHKKSYAAPEPTDPVQGART